MADIFISYARKDSPKAKVLAEALGAFGWDVWWDRKIPIGKSFHEVIEKAITESKCVVTLWSRLSVSSDWVRNEAEEGKRRGILVPALLEDVAMPLGFRHLQAADLSDWEPGSTHAQFDQLVSSITRILRTPETAGTTMSGREPLMADRETTHSDAPDSSYHDRGSGDIGSGGQPSGPQLSVSADEGQPIDLAKATVEAKKPSVGAGDGAFGTSRSTSRSRMIKAASFYRSTWACGRIQHDGLVEMGGRGCSTRHSGEDPRGS